MGKIRTVQQFMIGQNIRGLSRCDNFMLLRKDANGTGNLFCNGQIMRGRDNCFPLFLLIQDEFNQPGLAARIKTRCWFVHQPDIRLKS